MKTKMIYKLILIFILCILLQISMNYVVEAVTAFTIDDCPYDIEFVKIDTEFYLSMGIDTQGYLWAWGHSNYEVFGEEGITASNAPKKVSETLRFKDFAVSDDHILAIGIDGSLYAWGDNRNGQLGDGGLIKSVQPKRIKSGTKFSQIAVSKGNGSMAIDTDGNLWAWGSYTGGLGLGNITGNVLTPQKVSESIKFSKVTMGGLHTLAIDINGKLYTWGNNLHGQLGNGTKDYLSTNVPTLIMSNKSFKEVAAATQYSMAIDTNGNIWAWGSNDEGQLGDGTIVSSNVPKQITSGKVFNKIDAGSGGLTNEGASFAIDNEGKLWSWGTNSRYWLGSEEKENVLQPSKVLEQLTFKEISAGQYYAIGIDVNGESWSWGYFAYSAKATGMYAPENKAIRFTGDDYVVTFKDGTRVVKTENVKFNKSATPPALEKVGYTLSWDNNYKNIMEDITVNAVWEQSTYKVTLEPNGGTINSGNVTSYTYGVGANLPINVTRKNYTLVGWYDNKELTGEAISAIGTNEKGDKTYYAKWLADEYRFAVNSPYELINTITDRISPYTTKEEFVKHIQTNGEIVKIENAKGQVIENDEYVTTASTLYIEYLGEEYTYSLVVIGDIDRNGKLTVTDLSMMNQVLIDSLIPDALQKRAADIDASKKITITDLSMINQALVGSINL